MDRLSKALSLNQNRSSNCTKEKEENMISQKNEKSLQDWKLPPSPPSDSFKRKGILHFSPDRTVKTVEREIRLSEGFSSIPLITENPQRNKTLHVGMIQVALKPTKLGSDTSAVICLRDKSFLKFNLSVLAMVESSLCDGPIYFFYFPSHCLSMSDPYLKSTFAVDVKTQGSGAILMYRFHYKVTEADVFAPDPKKTRNPIDGVKGTTTLFVTDVARNNSVVSNKIYWDQVTVPDIWKVRSDPPSSSSAGGQVAVASAPVDWKEAAEAHVLKVDVPGLKKEEIRVEVEDGGILQISGERRKEEAEEDEKWLCVERSSGKFVRRLKLPENAKLDEVKAAVENGVLTVTAPKMEVGKKPLVKVIDISG